MSKTDAPTYFTLSFPGGRVARIPQEVVEKYMQAEARACHADEGSEGPPDVVAHSLSEDPMTGISDWHLDWECGTCDYTDESGFTQRIRAWHRHPTGTEYAEIYLG